MEECNTFIKVKREARHLKTLERQRDKFERLCQKIPVATQTSNMAEMAMAAQTSTHPMYHLSRNKTTTIH